MTSHQNGNRAVPGAILVESSTAVPEPLRLESDTGDGWAMLANHPNGDQLEKTLSAVGWTWFYMAGTIRKIGFGFERQRMIDGALRRLMAAAKLQACNCLEIDDVATHSFLGMPYVSVSAHARHIQQGIVFAGR